MKFLTMDILKKNLYGSFFVIIRGGRADSVPDSLFVWREELYVRTT